MCQQFDSLYHKINKQNKNIISTFGKTSQNKVAKISRIDFSWSMTSVNNSQDLVLNACPHSEKSQGDPKIYTERIRDKKNEKGHNRKQKCLFRMITAREGSAKSGFQGCSGDLMPNCKAQLGFKSSPRFQGAEWEMLLALAFSRTGSNPSETRRSIEHSGTTGIFF